MPITSRRGRPNRADILSSTAVDLMRGCFRFVFDLYEGDRSLSVEMGMVGRKDLRAARRRSLLAAIMETFAAKGFQGAGIAEIAAACGIAPANLYRYFASKDDMVRAIVVAQREEIAAQLAASIAAAEGMAEASGRWETALGHFLMSVISQATAPPMRALWLEILAEAARNPAIASLLREDDAHLVATFTALVEQGIAPDALAPRLPAAAVARLLIALLDGAMARAAYDPGFDQAAFTQDAMAILLQRSPS